MISPSTHDSSLRDYDKFAPDIIEFDTLKPLQALCRETAEKNPKKTALVFGKRKITFGQMQEKVNQLAFFLTSHGILPGNVVAIAIERSPEMIIAILGILKIGASFLPIDPHHPHHRIGFMMADAGVKMLLVSRKHAIAFTNRALHYFIEDILEPSSQFSPPVPDIPVPLHNTAYIIYTSGSTGNPKGVVVRHRSILHYIKSCVAAYAAPSTNTSGSFIHLALNFDASLTAIFVPLVTGKTMVISAEEQLEVFNDPNLVAYAPYDFIKLTPAQLSLLELARNPLARSVTRNFVVGGEALHPTHFAFLKKQQVDAYIINEYGPTEATVGCISHRFHVNDHLPPSPNGVLIGKPMPGVTAYILDPFLKPVALGSDGEIYIGGIQVAAGYLNRPELTNTRFVADPADASGNARIYASGDIGRFNKDGDIEFIGRTDDQVKIRGYRVEIGEVESSINHCDLIESAAVVTKTEITGDKKLVAYFSAADSAIRRLENELQLLRVASWKTLYETTYGETEVGTIADPEFNIIGWNDSFTGGTILPAAMKEWLQDIVEIILSAAPRNVFEIGCGTGLIFYQLAGKVNKYIGRDLSESSIRQIRKRISEGKRNYGLTDLGTAAAHEVTANPGDEIDTVVLNSMVQYFPGASYLTSVIEKALHLLTGAGRVIVGDVRDNRLLTVLKARLHVLNMAETTDIKEFKWIIEQEALKEEELCLSPDYFYRLPARFPQISHVQIQLKSGVYENELTLYRYNVILHVGPIPLTAEANWQKWNQGHHAEVIRQGLESGAAAFHIAAVPNPRLSKERILLQALTHDLQGSIRQWLPLPAAPDDLASRVNELLESAVQNGYQVCPMPNEDPLLVNLVITKKLPVVIHNCYALPATAEQVRDTNIPLFTEIGAAIQKDLRLYLQKQLPAYMVPSELTPVRQLPQTGNGKVDRKFLSLQKERQLTGKLQYRAPENQLEQQLATAWEQVMDIRKPSILDNFFELGGHSLMAMRLVAEINRKQQAQLTIRDLFVHPTIQELAAYLSAPADSDIKSPTFQSLVLIKPGVGRVPLYIVCGSGGTVYNFKDFAEMLHPQQPVYGLQQPFETQHPADFPDTIEAIAAKYISEILLLNPSGPYALAGHCLGGLVAFEMTRQLERVGKKVHLLAAFDTILEKTGISEGRQNGLVKAFKKGKSLLNRIYSKVDFELFLWRRHTRQAIRYKIKTFRKKLYPAGNNGAGMEAFDRLTKVYDKAGKNYKMKPYNVDIEVFYAKERYYFMDINNKITYKELALDEEVENLWQQYARSVNVYKVDGEHSTIFYPTFCKNFAQLVQEALDR